MTYKQRVDSFATWGPNCVYCKKDLLKRGGAFIHYSCDHLIPRKAARGSNQASNLLPSCYACNGLKGEYVGHLAATTSIVSVDGFFMISDEQEFEKALSAAQQYVRKKRLERKATLASFTNDVAKRRA